MEKPNEESQESSVNNWDGLYRSMKKFSKETQEGVRLAKEKSRLAKEEQEKRDNEIMAKLEKEKKERLEKEEKEKLEAKNKAKEEKAEADKKEQDEVSKLIEDLDTTDYTLLECQRRENILLSLRIGMIEQLDSIEKLFRCGLVKKLERKLTFSEKEKIERQKDTPQFKQYIARIKRIMDSELKQRIKDYQTKLGLKKPDDWLDLTEKGKEVVEKKRKELESVWAELQSSYEKGNKQVFREQVDKNRSMFPLFMIMGFANGAMMGTMLGNMGMNSEMYMQDMDMAYNDGYADGSGGALPAEGGDFGDTGGDGGGFMEGGMDVGF